MCIRDSYVVVEELVPEMHMGEHSHAGTAGAMALSLGMALQNVPEGAAISLPLQKEGVSKGKAFLYGRCV